MSRNGTSPVWIEPLEVLLRDEGADREERERDRGAPARTCVRGEPEQRQRREDEHDLRRVREVAVQVARGVPVTR